MKRIFVVDVMAMAFRTFHALSRRPLTNKAGFPTSAIYGSAMFLMKLIAEERPDYLVLASDTAGPNFRHEIYPEYKANRGEMPEDLAVQIPELFKMFRLWGLPLIKEDHLEADDLIGAIAKQWTDQDTSCYIVSGDKDFMQLIDEQIFLYAPKKGGANEVIGFQGVLDKFGCKPEQVTDVQAICGDSVDNVPGVKGIGEKGASTLIGDWGSLEGIYENLEDVRNKRQKEFLREQKDMAFLSRQLVTIKTDAPLSITKNDAILDPDKALACENLLDFFDDMNFRSLHQRVQEAISGPELTLETVTTGSTEKAKKSKKAADQKSEEATRLFELAKSRGQYDLIDTREKFDSVLKQISAASEIAFDTETTGLSLRDDRPIGISLAWAKGQACYIPLNQDHLKDLSPEAVVSGLKPIFESENGPIKIAHNLKFDYMMLRHLGIHLNGPVGDSMIVAFILNPTRKSYGIDALSLEDIGIEKIPTTALMGTKKQINMADVPADVVSVYASEDADCCLQLYQKLFPQLDKDLLYVYEKIDLPTLTILAKMEFEGISIDHEALAGLSESLLDESLDLQEEIYKEAGEEFNINSPKQLQVILFEKLKIHEKLGVKKLKKTKSGISTDVSVLESLSAHPLPTALLTYREVSKLRNTYVDTLPQLIHESSGRIHTSFHPTGTATGRLSSSHPNLQNIPIRTKRGRAVRSAFVPPEGMDLISADYSQIELRILAHISKDEGLQQAFRDNLDIHTSTAASMFKKDPAEVSHSDRSQAKAINYGIAYGMGPQRLAKTTGVSLREAKDFIERYFDSFPGIKSYIDGAILYATEHGYSKTILGRRRPIDGLDGKSGPMALVNSKNIAVNSPIQGSAADLMKLAMIKIDQELSENNVRAKMLLQVHDELVFECPSEETESVCQLIRHGMEHAMELSVPLKADIGIGKNWLEAH